MACDGEISVCPRASDVAEQTDLSAAVQGVLVRTVRSLSSTTIPLLVSTTSSSYAFSNFNDGKPKLS